MQERIENDIEPLSLLKQPKNPTYPHNSHNTEIGCQRALKQLTWYAANDHQKIEDVPSALEVEDLVGDYFYGTLENEDVIEHVLYIFD